VIDRPYYERIASDAIGRTCINRRSGIRYEAVDRWRDQVILRSPVQECRPQSEYRMVWAGQLHDDYLVVRDGERDMLHMEVS
jgi:hypothetical protein